MLSLRLTFVCLALATTVHSSQTFAGTNLFLGQEYQGQNATGQSAGTIRGGDPAGDQAFLDFLATGGNTGLNTTNIVSSNDFMPGVTNGGMDSSAVWGVFADAGNQNTYNFSVGGVSIAASAAQVAFDAANPSIVTNFDYGNTNGTPSNLDGFGNNGTTMQSGSARPDFASGANSGAYLGTESGGGSDNDRNAVLFDLTNFAGGGTYSFGIFAGDLETGDRDVAGIPVPTGVSGHPSNPTQHGGATGFLRLLFADATPGDFSDNPFQDIVYTPDSTIFGDAAFENPFTGVVNNESETYGNETGRFIGFSSTGTRIAGALFVVGDDDLGDDADSEHLSFIAPTFFLSNATGAPTAANPEPGSLVLASIGAGMMGWYVRRRRRLAMKKNQARSS